MMLNRECLEGNIENLGPVCFDVSFFLHLLLWRLFWPYVMKISDSDTRRSKERKGRKKGTSIYIQDDSKRKKTFSSSLLFDLISYEIAWIQTRYCMKDKRERMKTISAAAGGYFTPSDFRFLIVFQGQAEWMNNQSAKGKGTFTFSMAFSSCGQKVHFPSFIQRPFCLFLISRVFARSICQPCKSFWTNFSKNQLVSIGLLTLMH